MVALRFFRAAREDTSLGEQLGQLDPADGLAPVLAAAEAANFSVSIESLRAAHAHDWALRRARYLVGLDIGAATAERAASTVAVVKSASSST